MSFVNRILFIVFGALAAMYIALLITGESHPQDLNVFVKGIVTGSGALLGDYAFCKLRSFLRRAA